MGILKQRKLTLTLLLILAAGLGICIYSIWHYQGSPAVSASAGKGQTNLQAGGGFGANEGGRRPGGAITQGPGQGSKPAGQGVQQRGNRPQGGIARTEATAGAGGTGSSAASSGTAQPQASISDGATADAKPQADSGGASDKPSAPQAGSDGGARRAAGATGGGKPGFTPGGGGARGSAAYSTPLAAYTIAFFLLAAAAYVGVTRMKLQLSLTEGGKRTIVWTVLGTGLLLRIAAAPWIPGHPFDIGLFKSWAASAADHFSEFYVNGSSDYPPLYVYMLYAIGKLTALPGLSSYNTLLIKLPSIAADVATAYLLYRVARSCISYEMSLLIALFYTFNPAVFINSTFWGQVDSFFTLIVIAAVVLLSQHRLGWSTALFTAAVLMKPQGIIYLPLLGFELIRSKQWKAWLTAAAASIGTTLLVVLPFSFGQHPLWLVKLYAGTVNEYPYASVNGFNFFALLGANYKQDASTLWLFSYHIWGMAFIVLITMFSWWVYHQGGARFASLAAMLQIAGVFTFSSSMHERYLFPAAALALLAYEYLKDRRLLWLAAGFSLTIFMNTYAVLYNATSGAAAYNFTLIATSLINVLLVLYMLTVSWKLARAALKHRKAHTAPQTIEAPLQE